jgi:hypothetical protein
VVGHLLSGGYQIALVDKLQHGFNNNLSAAVAAQAAAIYFCGAGVI